jgi:hypothetical protein
MKRAIQIFAILLIGLLTAGPAWAAVSCALGDYAMGSSCPMGMATMDADCPMSHALASTDCSQDCCNRAMPQVTGFLAFTSKPRLLAPPVALQTPAPSEATFIAAKPHAVDLIAADSPPRYLLLRVFRI